uniref:TSA: Wollemia nobilis Ref_Wollemi_Transcript_13190_924 transcribed RNA sequence n=1 Tax=Wollemia nobilis TaxID=56998 RepID=A0A0C9QR52_9CONI
MSDSANRISNSVGKPDKTDSDSEQTPLLDEKPVDVGDDVYNARNQESSALGQTLASAAHLANLLPTGTLLLFQVLCPLVSNNGHCDATYRYMTAILLAVCGLSGFLLNFTDSFKGSDGKVIYGVVTPRGFKTFEYVRPGVGPADPGMYKLRAMDFVHAFLSLLVFAAVALYNKNVVGCFYPSLEEEKKEVLDVLPVAIGLVCSLLFVALPTTRHGIGYPVSK